MTNQRNLSISSINANTSPRDAAYACLLAATSDLACAPTETTRQKAEARVQLAFGWMALALLDEELGGRE